MKKNLGRATVLLAVSTASALLLAPIVGSAADLSNTPFSVRAQNSSDSARFAIRPFFKATPAPTTDPSAPATSSPGGSSTPAPTATPTPSYPTPTPDTEFTWAVEPDGSAKLLTLKTGSKVTDVVIPQTAVVSGVSRTVTNIAQLSVNSRSLTSVVIPDTVKTIGSYAFDGNKLASIQLPSGLTSLSSNAFSNNYLTSVTIPDSLTSISPSTFQNNRLSSVNFGKSVTSIGNTAFDHNVLTGLILPSSVTAIGYGAFSNNLLASADLSSSKLTAIPDSAFRYNSLTSLALPSSLKTIGDFAFLVNPNLPEVTIPAGVTSIGLYGFLGPKKIYMEGNAPTITDTSSSNPSFGPSSGKVVYYHAGATGFTSPTWKGYTTATY